MQPDALAPLEHYTATIFAQHVRESLEGPLLRWSLRQKLLADAARLGLRRFDANLIIAIVQRETETTPQSQPAPRAFTRLAPWAVFLIVQGLIVLATWRILAM